MAFVRYVRLRFNKTLVVPNDTANFDRLKPTQKFAFYHLRKGDKVPCDGYFYALVNDANFNDITEVS